MTNTEFTATKAWLLQVRGLDREIRDLEERAARLGASLTGGTIVIGERVKASRENTEEQKRIAYSDLIAALNAQKDTLNRFLREVNEIISTIPDSRIRRLLSLYYIDCMTWETVAERMELSDRQVYRLYPKAIKAAFEAKQKAGA